jgi:ankyrin repeat protein
MARLLVQHGADVNRREAYRDQSALMWAAAENHGEMVEFLVSQKAELDVRAKSTDWDTQISSEPRVQYRPTGGLTPLLYAARAGCLRCVTSIVGAGANVDKPNPDGMTPMMMALDNGYPAVAQYLLDHGANPHTWDWWGRTPLYVAVTMRGGPDSRQGPRPPESLAFIKAVLDAGVNPNPQLAFKEPSRGGRDNRFRDDLLTTGATPLLRAAQTFDNDVVRALLAHGALVDLPNASGVTPFMAAAGVGARTGSSVLGPRRAGQRDRAVARHHGDASQGRRRRQRTDHRRDQPDWTHRPHQHDDEQTGADRPLPRRRARANRGGQVPAGTRGQGGHEGRRRQDGARRGQGDGPIPPGRQEIVTLLTDGAGPGLTHPTARGVRIQSDEAVRAS